jgi:osmoprotectant transport system permease protein
MLRTAVIIAALLPLALMPSNRPGEPLRVASKKFTESVILGEIAAQTLRAAGQPATHVAELGGTQLVYDALRRGEIDVYPEYTGTLRQEIFAGKNAESRADLERLLADDGIHLSQSLGFSNNYAIAVRHDTAARLGLKTISELSKHPELRFGFSDEFLERADGWKNLRLRYNLSQQQVSGIDHDLAYGALQRGDIDAMDVYTTDARLAELNPVLLEDDLHFFPHYDAVLLWRNDLADRSPAAVKALANLEGQIQQADIIKLNASVQSQTTSEAQAANQFLRDKTDVSFSIEEPTLAAQVWSRTREHLDLVARSLLPAILVAIPLGVLSAKRPRLGRVILGAAGIVQTIPALALLVMLIAPVAYLGLNPLGAGSMTAVAALFLYSLLPIVQNTATGLATIPPELHESALALGLSRRFRLWHIELPLASPSILAGIKTAAVLNVGFATLGALVGARGYGQPILAGIRLNNTALILQGAIPAACLAILLQLAFELIERRLLPPGLRRLDTSSHA